MKPEENSKNESEAQQKAQHFDTVGHEDDTLTGDGLTGGKLAGALAMLAKLSLTDAERAEAVRRLLGDRSAE